MNKNYRLTYLVCSITCMILVCGFKHVHAAWTLDMIDGTARDVGGHSQSAIGPDNRLHVAYYDSDNEKLKYAVKGTNGWIIEETIDDSASFIGQMPSIAIDANGYPHIVYQDKQNGDLKYAYNIGNDWVTEIIQDYNPGVHVGDFSSIAVDSNGVPCVAYYLPGADDLLYTKRISQGSWTGPVLIDAEVNSGQYCSLALDENDNPRIAYATTINGNTHHLRYVEFNGSWGSPEDVRNFGSIPSYVSLALDKTPENKPTIAYYDNNNNSGKLMLTYHDGNEWIDRLVSTAGPAHQYVSLKLDSGDNPHVTTYRWNSSNNKIQYARWTGAEWDIQDIDAELRWSEMTSLSLDTNDNPHITYYAGQSLNYAANEINQKPSLTLILPNGGEHWSGIHDITWNSNGYWARNEVTILYSRDSGQTYDNDPIASGIANTGSYSWNTSTMNELTLRIKVIKTDNINTFDESDADLVIDNTPPNETPLIVTSQADSQTQITWISRDMIDTLSPPVQYFFESWRHDDTAYEFRDWIADPQGKTYTRGGLETNTSYKAHVKGGDSATPLNETAYSSFSNIYTLAYEPGLSGYSNVTNVSLRANWTHNNNPTGTFYWCEMVGNNSVNSGWTMDLFFDVGNLTPGTEYTFQVKAKNHDDIETGWINLGPITTDNFPTVTVTSPNGGEAITNSPTAITWSSSGYWDDNNNVRIIYSDDGGATYPTPDNVIAPTWPNNGSFDWNISGLADSNLYRIKVERLNEPNIFDTSDANFAIDHSPPTGSINIADGGKGYVGSVFVTLDLRASDPHSGIVSMQLSNDNSQWSSEVSFETPFAWRLTDGEGPKIVYVRYKNGAGLWNAGDISDTTTVSDETIPEGLPGKPVIIQEGPDRNTIKITWDAGTSQDPESGIAGFFLEVGTAGQPDAYYRSDVGDVTEKNLYIQADGEIRARIKAVNGVGLSGVFSDPSNEYQIVILVAPVISQVSPLQVNRRSSLYLSIIGNHFTADSTVLFSNPGITVNQTNFIDENRLTVYITIDRSAVVGSVDITVTTNAGLFAIGTGLLMVQEGFAGTTGQVKIQGGKNGYVNPALSEEVSIHFNASHQGTVTLRIYTISGTLVWDKTLDTAGGEDVITWNCWNTDDRIVSSGIYIAYIEGPGIKTTRKIAILQ